MSGDIATIDQNHLDSGHAIVCCWLGKEQHQWKSMKLDLFGVCFIKYIINTSETFREIWTIIRDQMNLRFDVCCITV